MSTPGVYFGDGMHMSAVLKADYKRVRKAHPERYLPRKINVTEMNGQGQVTTISVREDSMATPPTPRARHRYCTEE